MRRMFRHKSSRVPVDQVKQGKQINPDDVDEVPVEASDFDGSVVLGREASVPCHEKEPEKNSQADDHVQSVQSRHDEIKREKNLCVSGIGVLPRMSRNLFVIETERRAGNV